jgi:hypothetical protein
MAAPDKVSSAILVLDKSVFTLDEYMTIKF